MVKVTLSIPKEIEETSKEYAEKTGRTFSGLVKYCLRKELNKNQQNDR